MPNDPDALTGRGWRIGTALAFALAVGATVPTVGDIGLTWDEPSYRTSQLVSARWWEAWTRCRSLSDAAALVTPDALLFYWPYARYGYNFHPPLAGQLNLLTHALFGAWMKDFPSRRMASVFEYSATIALAFGFLSRRYGAWVGGVAAGALFLMPRVHGDGQLAGTDTPGLLLWAMTALAFWKGLHEPDARKWRVLVGVGLGLAFVEKMAAVAVLGPLLAWLVVSRLPPTLYRRGGWAAWVDGVVTSTLMLLPIGLAFREVLRLSRLLPPPNYVNLFTMHPRSAIPGGILLLPAVVWIVRRLAGRIWKAHPVWGAERPGLETFTSVLAFAPLVAWLGNPVWWRETLPRMAHYYQINADRRGALPDIRIIYFGEIYVYSLPWHNAWVLIAITVPAGILLASLVGLAVTLAKTRKNRDPLPWFFALNLAFLPILRMLPTPAHDGVRLLLPTFFFLAAFAGWGVVAIGDGLARLRLTRAVGRGLVAGLVLGPAAWQLAAIHPYELSYYNEFIGGTRGAWEAGFEPTYWYEAFGGATLEEINRTLPDGSAVHFYNDLITTPTPATLQELGQLKGTITLGPTSRDRFPHGWMLTHDSKATPLTRLMFAMTPLVEGPRDRPDLPRLATVVTPEAVSRAWALDLLTRGPERSEVGRAPAWVRDSPFLRPFARFWGEGLTRGPTPSVAETGFALARSDPVGLVAAAKVVAAGGPFPPDSAAGRLRAFLDRRHGRRSEDRLDWQTDILLRSRPEGLVEAARILVDRPDAVRSILLRSGFTDPARVGGYLDKGIAR